MDTVSRHRLQSDDAAFRIGRSVRALLRKRDLTLSALAKEATLSEKTLSNVLAGKHSPRLSTLALIAAALGVDVAELIERTGDAA